MDKKESGTSLSYYTYDGYEAVGYFAKLAIIQGVTLITDEIFS